MGFGKNLQFLRKMRNKMTQEELAEKLGVSRQTVSKWESGVVYPEMDKVIELCNLFSCTMDELIREDLDIPDEAYSNIRFEDIEAFCYSSYAVVSKEPEEDAIRHVEQWAEKLGIKEPEIIGWDFPVVSQEQINVHNMHGYAAALILGSNVLEKEDGKNYEELVITRQEKQKYIAITVNESGLSPFYVIPNAYKMLMSNMQVNGIKQKNDRKVLSCFEKEYYTGGKWHMDIHIAVE